MVECIWNAEQMCQCQKCSPNQKKPCTQTALKSCQKSQREPTQNGAQLLGQQ